MGGIYEIMEKGIDMVWGVMKIVKIEKGKMIMMGG